MSDAVENASLAEIIGTRTLVNQIEKQLLKRFRIVIYSVPPHCLFAQWKSGVHNRGADPDCFRRISCEWANACRSRTSGTCTAWIAAHPISHRYHHRNVNSDSDDVHVGDGVQPLNDLFKLFRVHHQQIAAKNEHIPDLRMAADKGYGLLQCTFDDITIFLTYYVAPGAIAAVG